jgi:hypothetical protein
MGREPFAGVNVEVLIQELSGHGKACKEIPELRLDRQKGILALDIAAAAHFRLVFPQALPQESQAFGMLLSSRSRAMPELIRLTVTPRSSEAGSDSGSRCSSTMAISSR